MCLYFVGLEITLSYLLLAPRRIPHLILFMWSAAFLKLLQALISLVSSIKNIEL